MTDAEGSTWCGPFESRAAFEAFQDESIARLVDFGLGDLPLTKIPNQLKVQLWELGKYLPAAILGLGRHNPESTYLHVFGEKAEAKSRKDPNYYKTSRINPGPTILRGEAAYERIVTSWHEVDDLRHQHRFAVQSAQTPHNLEIAHSGKTCLLIGHWTIDAARQRYCKEVLTLPDTSRDANMHDVVDWKYATAGATDGWGPHGNNYTTTPLLEAEEDRSELPEGAVSLLAGEAALKALQGYGRVGVYQQLLHSDTRQLLAGLSLGPNMATE